MIKNSTYPAQMRHPSTYPASASKPPSNAMDLTIGAANVRERSWVMVA